ncbi:unnamed protein product [Prunus armeniaca]|uniref:Uncharacterized protein n=1 Tax=Prunus armeniaca TaxID=36596 RepID=A0A6J5W4B3_PRUAR|nr:unnamed protein product [Prunus armeniaca]
MKHQEISISVEKWSSAGIQTRHNIASIRGMTPRSKGGRGGSREVVDTKIKEKASKRNKKVCKATKAEEESRKAGDKKKTEAIKDASAIRLLSLGHTNPWVSNPEIIWMQIYGTKLCKQGFTRIKSIDGQEGSIKCLQHSGLLPQFSNARRLPNMPTKSQQEIWESITRAKKLFRKECQVTQPCCEGDSSPNT